MYRSIFFGALLRALLNLLSETLVIGTQGVCVARFWRRVRLSRDNACASLMRQGLYRPDRGRLMNKAVRRNDVLFRITCQRDVKVRNNMSLTVSVFIITLGKLCVRSTQGLMRTAPAGCSMPRSLRTVRALRQRPPPAESPAMTIFEGGIGLCRASGGGEVR